MCDPLLLQMLQFRHDIVPVPRWNLRITNLVDYVTEIREAEYGVAVGPIQQADIFAAAPQSDCTLNSFKGHSLSHEIPGKFLVCRWKLGSYTGSLRKKGSDGNNIPPEL